VLDLVLEEEGIPVPVKPPNALIEWLSKLFDGTGMGGTLADGAAIAGSLLLAWILWRLIAMRRSRVEGKPLTERQERQRARAAVLRIQAAEARTAGDLGLALRLEVAALVVGLGEHGDLEYRPAWTLRELLRRGKPREPLASSLLELIDEVEPLCFSGVEVEEEQYLRISDYVERQLAVGSRA
jgi:hypothetical protein